MIFAHLWSNMHFDSMGRSPVVGGMVWRGLHGYTPLSDGTDPFLASQLIYSDLDTNLGPRSASSSKTIFLCPDGQPDRTTRLTRQGIALSKQPLMGDVSTLCFVPSVVNHHW